MFSSVRNLYPGSIFYPSNLCFLNDTKSRNEIRIDYNNLSSLHTVAVFDTQKAFDCSSVIRDYIAPASSSSPSSSLSSSIFQGTKQSCFYEQNTSENNNNNNNKQSSIKYSAERHRTSRAYVDAEYDAEYRDRTKREFECKNHQGIFRQVTAASLSAMITVLFTTPFDVIKTRLQVQHKPTNMNGLPGNTYFYANSWDAVRQIVSKEGFRSLWRGMLPTLVMQIPSTGIYYTSYDQLKNYLSCTKLGSSMNPIYIAFFAGLIARSFGAVISTPFEYIRTLVQSQSLTTRELLFPAVSKLKNKQQPHKLNLFRGLQITLMRDITFSALYWPLYEFMKTYFSELIGRKDEHNFAVHFYSGALCGMIVASFTNPIDVVKTQIQSETGEKSSKIWKTLKRVYREDGLRGFSRGMVPRVAKVAPSCAIMISSYELLKHTILNDS